MELVESFDPSDAYEVIENSQPDKSHEGSCFMLLECLGFED